jgi:hypothetical protein
LLGRLRHAYRNPRGKAVAARGDANHPSIAEALPKVLPNITPCRAGRALYPILDNKRVSWDVRSARWSRKSARIQERYGPESFG